MGGALAALASIGGLAACGGGAKKTPPSTTAAPPVATVAVTETEFKLTPANPSISKSGVITFKVTNRGTVAHSLEIEGTASGDAKLPQDLQPGQSATLTVTLKPGKYEWYCPVDGHKAMGMRGEITVSG
jgi:uncharacterized cupredoxin-like copper-binding protein